MFKDYLRIRTKGFQLAILLSLWSGLFLIVAYLQSILTKYFFKIDASQLKDFTRNALIEHPNYVIISNFLYSFLIFALPALLFAYLAHPQPGKYLGLKRPKEKSNWLWIIVLSIGAVPFLILVGALINQLNLGETAKKLQEARESQLNSYLASANLKQLILNILFLAMVPAFCEELFFRGIVQKFAFSYLKKAWPAILVSGFAFSLMHGSIYDFVPILLAGIILAWIYQSTQSLWLSVLFHFLFNGLQVTISYIALHNEAFNQAGQNHIYLRTATIIGGLLMVWAVKNIYSKSNPFPNNWSVEEFEEETENNNENQD